MLCCLTLSATASATRLLACASLLWSQLDSDSVFPLCLCAAPHALTVYPSLVWLRTTASSPVTTTASPPLPSEPLRTPSARGSRPDVTADSDRDRVGSNAVGAMPVLLRWVWDAAGTGLSLLFWRRVVEVCVVAWIHSGGLDDEEEVKVRGLVVSAMLCRVPPTRAGIAKALAESAAGFCERYVQVCVRVCVANRVPR